MLTFSLDKCPNCNKENVAGTLINVFFSPKNDDIVSFIGHCNNCHFVVIGVSSLRLPLQRISHNAFVDPFSNLSGDIENYIDDIIEDIYWYPEPTAPEIPDNVPEHIGKKFLQAELLFNQNGMEDPAGNAYRSTLERAIKHLAPNSEGTLYKRIEDLYKNGLIVKSMADFSHRIRILGNSATHDDEEISREDLKELRLFTDLFLKYMFTLPSMIPE